MQEEGGMVQWQIGLHYKVAANSFFHNTVLIMVHPLREFT